jgi:threonine dehydrogenase-like Zn-dependent dehydrogenase
MRRLMSMIQNGRVNLRPIVTHAFALDNIEEAFTLFSEQRDRVLKVALYPDASRAATGPQFAEVAALDEVC